MSAVETTVGPVTAERLRLAAVVREAAQLEDRARREHLHANGAPARARAALEAAGASGAAESTLVKLRRAVADAESRVERMPQSRGGGALVQDVETRGRLRAAQDAHEAARLELADYEAEKFDELVAEASPDAVALTAALGAALTEVNRAMHAWLRALGEMTTLEAHTGRGDGSDLPPEPVPQDVRQALVRAAADVAASPRRWLPLPAAVLPDVVEVPGV